MSFYIPIKQEFPVQFNIYIYIYNGNIMELVGNVTINQNIIYILYDGLVIFPSKKSPKHSLRAALAAATTSKWYW